MNVAQQQCTNFSIKIDSEVVSFLWGDTVETSQHVYVVTKVTHVDFRTIGCDFNDFGVEWHSVS